MQFLWGAERSWCESGSGQSSLTSRTPKRPLRGFVLSYHREVGLLRHLQATAVHVTGAAGHRLRQCLRQRYRSPQRMRPHDVEPAAAIHWGNAAGAGPERQLTREKSREETKGQTILQGGVLWYMNTATIGSLGQWSLGYHTSRCGYDYVLSMQRL